MTPTPVAEALLVVGAAFIGAWIVSYLLHSTIAIALAAALERYGRLAPLDHVRVWRFALVAPFLTAIAQMAWLPGAGWFSRDISMLVPQSLVDWRLGVVGLSAFVVSMVLVIIGWLAGSLVLHRVLGERRPAPERLQREVASLAVVVGCRVPLVTVSDRAPVPAAVGRAEVCVPRASIDALSADERRALLAHEVGHLVSRDPLWFAAAGNLSRLTAFQPLNRFALRRLRAASEEAADDFSVRATGDAVTLARALAGLVALPWTLQGGAAASGSPIVKRVGRLLSGEPPPAPFAKGAARTAAGVALVLMVVAAPGLRASVEGAAHRLSWLAPSRDEPNARMLDVRRFERALRDAVRNAFR